MIWSPFSAATGLTQTPDPVLQAAAEEELTAACTLKWAELARLIPWGDTYEGVSPANMTVQVERNYLWADAPGGDILCEVAVYLDAAHYAYAARASRVIGRTDRR